MRIGELTRDARRTVGAGAATRADWGGCARRPTAAAAHRQQAPRARARFDIASAMLAESLAYCK